jgi:hypothetical protein
VTTKKKKPNENDDEINVCEVECQTHRDDNIKKRFWKRLLNPDFYRQQLRSVWELSDRFWEKRTLFFIGNAAEIRQ